MATQFNSDGSHLCPEIRPRNAFKNDTKRKKNYSSYVSTNMLQSKYMPLNDIIILERTQEFPLYLDYSSKKCKEEKEIKLKRAGEIEMGVFTVIIASLLWYQANS